MHVNIRTLHVCSLALCGLRCVRWCVWGRYLSCEVLKDGCTVDGGGGAHPAVACRSGLQMPVDTTDWKLDKEGKKTRVVSTSTGALSRRQMAGDKRVSRPDGEGRQAVAVTGF